MNIKRDVENLEKRFQERKLNELIGNQFQNVFELYYNIASSIVLTFAPTKLRETTKSFTLTLIEGTEVLVGRNENGIVEYTIEIPKDEPVPLPAPEFKETLNKIKREKRNYKKISLTILLLIIFCMVCTFFLLIEVYKG